jgi:hypothetical protein
VAVAVTRLGLADQQRWETQRLGPYGDGSDPEFSDEGMVMARPLWMARALFLHAVGEMGARTTSAAWYVNRQARGSLVQVLRSCILWREQGAPPSEDVRDVARLVPAATRDFHSHLRRLAAAIS